MVDITLVELHLDGAEFTANAPGSGASDDIETESADGTSPPLGVVALAALLLLTAVAVAAKKLGGDDDESDTL